MILFTKSRKDISECMVKYCMNQMTWMHIMIHGHHANSFHFKGNIMTSEELKQERINLGLNITGMAIQLETPRGTYLKWERGERRVPGIVEVAINYLWFKKNIGKKQKVE